MFRNSMTKERVTVAMVALFLAVAGCQSTGNQGVETTGMETETLPEAGRVEGSELETMTQLEAVGFDTDRSALREDARLTLTAHAGAIQAHPEWGVLTVEGHCDERGSYEYNLALGKSRAEVVKRFLIEQGVPASRLTTVSFGESKPITMGHDELAWRQNRRSELQPEARTASLRP